MPGAVRVVDRIIDQGDFQGPPVDGQFLRYDESTGKFYTSGGAAGDLSYDHVQSSASTTWTVGHNLGRKPSVTVIDSGGNEVMGDVHHVDNNNLTVSFSVAFGGTALCR